MAISPSGEQWHLTSEDVEAVVVEVGGGLRSLTIGGVDVVAGYPQEAMASAGRGQLLVPWPNRIRDGRYRFDGQDHELPITERSTGHASHGLVRWAAFRPTEVGEDRIVVVHTLHPQPGYPFALETRVTWQVDPRGLTCGVAVTNLGEEDAPVGFGAHPYLALAGTPVAESRLRVPAEQVVLVDERMLPTTTSAVAGTPFDLREGPALAGRELDHAYTGLQRGEDGCWVVELETGERTVGLWGGPGLDWVQVFTGRADPGTLPPGHRPGVAVEPLSCPPDAFTSGEGLVTLRPGSTWTGQWGIEVR